MTSYMNEYLERDMDYEEIKEELQRLIEEYNDRAETELVIYSACVSKQEIPKITLDMDDYYVLHDLLNENDNQSIELYVESPGGSGEAAEEMGEFLNNNFEDVSFVISGEAKSAATLLTLSGNYIKMTETGSLGPIDAQVQVGRSPVSAYDYIDWVERKREEAAKNGSLNPFDAQMVAQISPGELEKVQYALDFAKKLVKKWLPKHKFRDWEETEDRGKDVTEEMKRERAQEIADRLSSHDEWLSHSRSLKISDLENIGLQITDLDEDDILSQIIYRIQTLLRLMFSSSSTYKIYATSETIITQQAVAQGQAQPPQEENIDLDNASGAGVTIQCENCGKEHKFFALFEEDAEVPEDARDEGYKPFPLNDDYECECGYEMNITGIINEVESRTGKKIFRRDGVKNG